LIAGEFDAPANARRSLGKMKWSAKLVAAANQALDTYFDKGIKGISGETADILLAGWKGDAAVKAPSPTKTPKAPKAPKVSQVAKATPVGMSSGEGYQELFQTIGLVSTIVAGQKDVVLTAERINALIPGADISEVQGSMKGLAEAIELYNELIARVRVEFAPAQLPPVMTGVPVRTPVHTSNNKGAPTNGHEIEDPPPDQLRTGMIVS
jgi:hypothetical protein